jgi:hypothetical protein
LGGDVQVQDLIKGYQIESANIQYAGNMAVLPLTSPQELTDRIADTDLVAVVEGHGSRPTILEFFNSSDKVGIVPQGSMVTSKQNVPDRIVPRGMILSPRGSGSVSAFYVRPESRVRTGLAGEPTLRILPPYLRALAITHTIEAPDRQSHLRMCTDLGSYFSHISIPGPESAYRTMWAEEFAAQFEPVTNQLGAIVLINNEVVAVDIMPTYRSWKLIWRTLIRDSYGADALRLGTRQLHITMNPSRVSSLASLIAEFEASVQTLVDKLKQQWAIAGSQTLSHQEIMSYNQEVRLMGFSSTDFLGQSVRCGSYTTYLSLVRRHTRFGNEPEKHFNDDSQEHPPYWRR